MSRVGTLLSSYEQASQWQQVAVDNKKWKVSIGKHTTMIYLFILIILFKSGSKIFGVLKWLKDFNKSSQILGSEPIGNVRSNQPILPVVNGRRQQVLGISYSQRHLFACLRWNHWCCKRMGCEAPPVISWFRFAPVTIVISTINHGYWSYKPTWIGIEPTNVKVLGLTRDVRICWYFHIEGWTCTLCTCRWLTQWTVDRNCMKLQFPARHVCFPSCRNLGDNPAW